MFQNISLENIKFSKLNYEIKNYNYLTAFNIPPINTLFLASEEYEVLSKKCFKFTVKYGL